jgi:hypothetical protein
MEQFANNAVTSLSKEIDSTQTKIIVDDCAGFPDSPVFRIAVENELMLVTGIDGNEWTVERGIEGTRSAIHPMVSPVSHTLTVEGLRNAVRQEMAAISHDITAHAVKKVGESYNFLIPVRQYETWLCDLHVTGIQSGKLVSAWATKFVIQHNGAFTRLVDAGKTELAPTIADEMHGSIMVDNDEHLLKIVVQSKDPPAEEFVEWNMSLRLCVVNSQAV